MVVEEARKKFMVIRAQDLAKSCLARGRVKSLSVAIIILL